MDGDARFNKAMTLFGEAVQAGPMETRSNEQLLLAWQEAKQQEDRLRELRRRIEWEIQKRMEAEGARALPDPNFDVTLEPGRPRYDSTILRGLFELLDEQVIRTAWTPEHEETIIVPERWDGTKLRALMKYGDAVKEIIEAATIRERPRLVIKPKRHTASRQEV